MAKVPYDDSVYLDAVQQISHYAGVIFDMEGSDKSTIEDVFEQTLDELEDED